MHYSIQEEQGASCVTMGGSFTFRDSRSFAKMLKTLCENGRAVEIRINLSRIEALDAMALAMLLFAFDTFKKKRLPLVFEQPQGKTGEALAAAARHNALTIAA